MAGVNGRFCQGVFGEEADDMGDEQADTSLAAGGDHGHGLLSGAGQGLFANDLFAGSGRLQDHLIMKVSGGTDVYHVYVG